jgi:UDP-glucose 4-epimerase
LHHLIKLLGRPILPVPHTLGARVLHDLFRYRLSSFPAPELDHIRYVCMVDDRRARDLMGYAPHHSLRDTARAVDDVL